MGGPRRFNKTRSPHTSSVKCLGCERDKHDHIKALKRGGADAPGNMQRQTKAAAKAKDRIE
jgi:hypothetical protein